MLYGKSPVEARYDAVLTTYNILGNKMNRKFLRKLPIHCLVVDEAQNLKNANSGRYSQLIGLPCERRLLLTGCPP